MAVVDVVHRVVAEGLALKGVSASAVMTRDPMVVFENDYVITALALMAKGSFSRLPVISKGTEFLSSVFVQAFTSSC